MPKILLIDDDAKRESATRAALVRLADGFFGDITFHSCSKSTYSSVLDSLKNDNSEKIVFLDLGFRDEQLKEGMWECVSDNLDILVKEFAGLVFSKPKLDKHGKTETTGSLSINGTGSGSLQFTSNVPTDTKTKMVSDYMLDGLSLLAGMTSSKNNPKTLVISVSQRGPVGAVKAVLTAIQNRMTTTGISNLRLEIDPDGRDLQILDDAESLLLYAKERWQIHFPRYRDDSAWVNNYVAKWIDYYRKLASKGAGGNFCRHGSIHKSPSEYAKMAEGMFCKTNIFTDDESDDLKTIYELGDNEPPPLFQKSSDRPVPGWKPINVVKAIAILECLSQMKVKVELHQDGIKKLRLPLCPAIGFLASLRVLLEQLKEDKMLNCDQKLRLNFQNDGPIRLSLPLNELPKETTALAFRWKEKVLLGRPQLEKPGDKNRGICAALWDISLGRVEIKKDFVTDPDELKLLGIFDGPGHPVTAIGFAPQFIHIYWS